MLPKETNMFVPALSELRKNKDGLLVEDLSLRLREYFPEITELDMRLNTKTRSGWFLNRTRHVRRQLLDQKYIKCPKDNRLRITRQGETFLRREAAEWAPEYSKELLPKDILSGDHLSTWYYGKVLSQITIYEEQIKGCPECGVLEDGYTRITLRTSGRKDRVAGYMVFCKKCGKLWLESKGEDYRVLLSCMAKALLPSESK